MEDTQKNMTLEEQIFALLGKQKAVTISTAESISAGGVAARLAHPAGASNYFIGGIVSYAYNVKERVLGVPKEVLDNPGAVSDECARRMAMGARQMLNSTLAVSTTGIAGPAGATNRKPVGLVYIAVAGPHGTTCEEHLFPGDREAITQASIECALQMVLDHLHQHIIVTTD